MAGAGGEGVGDIGKNGGFEKIEINNTRLLHADDDGVRAGGDRGAERASGDERGTGVDAAIEKSFGITVEFDSGDAAIAVKRSVDGGVVLSSFDERETRSRGRAIERSAHIEVVGELAGIGDSH